MFNPSRGLHDLLFGHGTIVKGSKGHRGVRALPSSSRGMMHNCSGGCVQAERKQHDDSEAKLYGE